MADGIQIRIEDTEANRTLESVRRASENPAAIMAQVSASLLQATRRHFERESGPDGPWPRLSPRTANKRIGKRRRGYDNMLRVSGRLYNSIIQDSGADYALVGSNLPYAALQQEGGTIQMPARDQEIYQNYNPKSDRFDPRFRRRQNSNFARTVKVGAHSITVPARSYLYLDEADRAEIEAVAADALRDEADLK